MLFGGADYKCGCLCTTYTTPNGTSFSFSAQTATRTVGGAPVTRFAPTQFNNSNYPTGPVWNAQLVDPFTNTTYDWQYGQMTCGPTDASKCGIQYSAVAQSGFCAITSPLRYVPFVQVPNPAFRPPNGANGLSYATGPGAGEYYTNPASTGVSGTSYVSASFANFSAPSPFLFTGANKSLATSLASGMLFENASKALLASFPSAAALQRFISHGVPGDTSVFGLNNDTSRLAEVIPLYPSSIGSNSAGLSPFLLGTAASTPRGGIQKEPGLNGAVIMVLLPNCSSGFSAAALGSSLGTIQFSCVSVPPVFVNDSSIINTVMYTGYGQGPPGALGTQVNAFQEYPFAVDFGATTPGVGASSGPGYVATLFFNNSIAGGTGQPLNAFLRVSAILNRMANSYLAATLAAAGANATFGLMPRASLRYLRDMPTQNSVIALDVGTFLGPLFYSWLSQMLLPVIVGLLVYEKEKNLRTMMKIQGLGDSAYIIVNYMYYFLLYFVFMLLIYFYGYILGAATNSLSLWTRSDPGARSASCGARACLFSLRDALQGPSSSSSSSSSTCRSPSRSSSPPSSPTPRRRVPALFSHPPPPTHLTQIFSLTNRPPCFAWCTCSSAACWARTCSSTSWRRLATRRPTSWASKSWSPSPCTGGTTKCQPLAPSRPTPRRAPPTGRASRGQSCRAAGAWTR